MQTKTSWDLDDGRVVQILYNISTDFDVDEVVSIDINNLMGEYLTAPVLFNTLANLRTLAMQRVSALKMELKVNEKQLWLDIIDSYDIEKKRKPNNDTIDAMIQTDKTIKRINKDLISAEKNAGLLDNLYWSMKEKCEKLNNLYHKITPEEFTKDIMEGQVNNVLIKIKKSLIK